MYSVINKDNGKALNDKEILNEVNRDRSSEWQDYTLEDLKENASEVLYWIDLDYYEVRGAQNEN
jgi:hypothetical protein